jgi:hypothetical protein
MVELKKIPEIAAHELDGKRVPVAVSNFLVHNLTSLFQDLLISEIESRKYVKYIS